MVQKRRFDNEEIFEVSSKHPRQLEHSNQLVSFSESVFPEDASQIPRTLEGGFTKGNTEVHEKLSSDIFTELPRSADDIETSVPGCTISSWATSSTSEEDSHSEAPARVSFFPEYFYPEHPIRTLAHCEEMYSILLDHPPRKPVPIGLDHQANIPAWSSPGTKNSSNCLGASEAVSDSGLVVEDEDEKRLMGSCVIPMPDLELSSCSGVKVGNGRTDCSCEDGGSVRCVRKHIMEAREKLMKNTGPERFMELGFCDMGEHVAQKWSEKDEHLFHEVVFSNPASMGKNFWQALSIVFPSRTKKEIVSYYFNVFMLRRRADQNRCYPMNIDSDNDEWQGSDDYDDNELGTTEEDDDSVVESPVYQDDRGYYTQSREDDLQEYDEDPTDGTCDNNVDFDSGGGITDISETSPRNLLNYCGSSPTIPLRDKTSMDERGDQEVQDDSCTSSDTGTQPKFENGNHWPSSFNGLSSGDGHEYVLEPCDAKVWEDAAFLTCPKVDFLPTCSMIEEVFGDGSWNYKARDGKSLS